MKIRLQIFVPVFILLCSSFACGRNLSTITELENLAKVYPEAPASDNNDWVDPEFELTLKKLKPSFLDRILEKIGLKSSVSHWEPEIFKTMLERIVIDREKRQYKSPYHVDVMLKKSGRCVIWGDLHGAFHSLTRDLVELRKIGLVTDGLKIDREDVYFVFIGDLISRSPYSLETLTIVLNLIEKNPGKVLYLRGNHEKRAYWENFGMRRALRLRAQHLLQEGDGEIPMSVLINKFFDTLPDAIKIGNIDDPKKNIAYCSHIPVDKKLLVEENVHAQILGEQRIGGLDSIRPLNFLGFLYGVSFWSLISCPIRVYQEFFDYHNDSFVILEMGDTVMESILSLYTRDARLDEPFEVTDYDFIFGRELKDKSEIKKADRSNPIMFGTLLPLSGANMTLGRSVNVGVDAAVEEKNTDLGIRNQLIKPLIFDDQFTPRITRNLVKKLREGYSVTSVLIPVGGTTLETYAKSDTGVFFPYTGASQFRDPEYKNMIHLRSSYADEARALVNYFIDVYGVKRFTFFYQDDVAHEAATNAAIEVLKSRGINNSTTISYALGKTDFTDLAGKLRASNPEAIGCFSASAQTQELISQLDPEFFLGRQLFGSSFLENATFRHFLSERGIDFTYSAVVPNPDTSNLSIVKEYRKSMNEHGYTYDTNSLEGYIATMLYLNALETIKPPYTKEKLLAHFEGFNDHAFKGLRLTFKPETRGFMLPVWLRTVDDEWITYNAKN